MPRPSVYVTHELQDRCIAGHKKLRDSNRHLYSLTRTKMPIGSPQYRLDQELLLLNEVAAAFALGERVTALSVRKAVAILQRIGA